MFIIDSPTKPNFGACPLNSLNLVCDKYRTYRTWGASLEKQRKEGKPPEILFHLPLTGNTRTKYYAFRSSRPNKLDVLTCCVKRRTPLFVNKIVTMGESILALPSSSMISIHDMGGVGTIAIAHGVMANCGHGPCQDFFSVSTLPVW